LLDGARQRLATNAKIARSIGVRNERFPSTRSMAWPTSNSRHSSDTTQAAPYVRLPMNSQPDPAAAA